MKVQKKSERMLFELMKVFELNILELDQKQILSCLIRRFSILNKS
jgi:hypothetical protein